MGEWNKMKTDKMSKKKMAEELMSALDWKDRDAEWTFANCFKHRSDLAYILMVASKGQYTAEK